MEKLNTLSGIEKENEREGVHEENPSEQDSWKYITGFVTGIRKENNTRYVSCNLTYPGTDAIIWCSKNHSVTIGDWIEAKISTSDYEKYFPPNPKPTTPRADIKSWKKIERPDSHSVVETAGRLKVKIKNFQVPSGHKKGCLIEDRFLGRVDGSKKIPDGAKTVDLLIRRLPVFKTYNGNSSCWSIETASIGSDSSSSTIAIERKQRQVKDSRNQKQSKKYDSIKSTKCVSQLDESSITSLPSSSGLQNHLVNDRDNQDASENHKNESKGVATTRILKRAVITYIKSHSKRSKQGKDHIAFLWLLDDHKRSVMLTSGFVIQEKEGIRTRLYPGYFFEGWFQQDEQGRWICTKHIRKLGKLMECIVYREQLELQLVTDNIDPESTDRFSPETYHCFIGKIIDIDNKLPKDCSSGVKINIKFSYIPSRADWFWIVSKVHNSSKHIQLLTEFHHAWHSPGIRNLISQKCIPEFTMLEDLMDTVVEVSRNARMPLESFEVDKENWKFAWVIEYNGDSASMIVFPRHDQQETNEMKKRVTNKVVYQKVHKMEAYKLYKVHLNSNGEVIEMVDCPQYFHADKSGNIEFKFVLCNDSILTKNVAIVSSINAPKWIGKLMFAHRRSITSRKVLMKAKFRILDDDDLFANDNLTTVHGVIFVNTGDSVECLSNQNFADVMDNETHLQGDKTYEHNLFKTKLLNLHPNQDVFPRFQAVCSILKNKQIVDEMELQGIDTDDLMQLQSSIRF